MVAADGGTNPFLAGQPFGTVLGLDRVPEQAPLQVPLTFAGDELLRFQGVSGKVTHTTLVAQVYGSPQPKAVGPDGDATLLAATSEHLGIAGLAMPAGALLGVFLDDSINPGSAPTALDFSSAASRDFDLLAPELFQPFFIGDGLREDGTTVQSFRVPSGATRLFVGTADPNAWSDNTGSFGLTVEQEIADITSFCTAKPSSEGCLPTIGYTGYPALNGSHAFDVVCSEVSPGTRGVLFYGHAQYGAAFQGGYLCTNVMIKRTPLVKSPPTPSGLACSSSFTFDFNAWILSGNDPTLVPGETIFAQWWMRDSGSWSSTGLSDSIEIQLCQ